MALDEAAEFGRIVGVRLLEADHLLVAAGGEVALFVEDVGHAAAHAGGEVTARGAEDDDASAGHVFAAVVAHAFDDGGDAGIAHAEAFAGHAAEEGFSGGRAVEGDVAEDDVVFGGEGRLGVRVDDDASAAEALADVVVGVAFDLDGHARGDEGAEGLARAALELQVDGAFR